MRRCVETEIFFYNKFLGIEIQKDTADGDQLHIEFQVKNQTPKNDCKITVLQKNDGFVCKLFLTDNPAFQNSVTRLKLRDNFIRKKKRKTF